jgi:nicotinamide mononucleotide transporter
VLDWVLKNYIEITGSLLGLIYVILSIRQNISLWLVGILSSAFYIVVFFDSKLYANMSLQFYYLIMSIYGWYMWKKTDNKNQDAAAKLSVTRISTAVIIRCLLIGIFLLILLFRILKVYTDSPFPGWDSFTTMLSIIATWMLTRKYIENWLLWIISDTVSVGLYFYMKLYPTTILFFVYTVMAAVGFIEWRKTIVVKDKIV